MANNTIFPAHKLYSAYAMINTLTGVKIKEDDFLEFSNLAMMELGYNTYMIKLKIEVGDQGYNELPCEVSTVLSVGTDQHSYTYCPVPEWRDGFVFIDRLGNSVKDLSPSLKQNMRSYVNYKFSAPVNLEVSPELEGETLYVIVEAKILDDEGLPLLFHKQVVGVAYYCLYLDAMKKMYRGMQIPDFNFIREKSINAMANARVPESISDNEWDQLMNKKVSFGRKSYNKDHNW